LLCTPDGTALGQGTAAYQVAAPRPGWAEINPEHWWQATCIAVRAAVGPASAQVAGLAVAGQMHGLILCAERAVVLRPAITWLDRRAEAEADEFERLPETLRARLGNAPSPGLAGPILLWLSRHEPDAYWQARWMLQPKDWLRFRLTGQAATDPTDASGTLLANVAPGELAADVAPGEWATDVAPGEWATDVVRALGLRPDLLPPILPPTAVAGALLPSAAEHLGLPPGLPVAVGAADTAASLLAADLPPQWGLLTLGTGGQLMVPSGTDPVGAAAGLNLFRSVDGGTYRLAGYQNVGVALDWVRRTLGASWDELYRTAARPWQADTPVFLPYLVSERWDQGGSGGAWTGLTLAHQRDDLLRAALEGVAFLLRGKLDDLRALSPPSPVALQLAGGGSQAPAWRQLLAEALAVPLHPVGTGWLTARGAAQLAAVAAGLVPDAKATARSDQNTEVVTGASRLAEPSYDRFASAASSLQSGLYPCIVLCRERGERPA
jgi:xylulokinase